MKFTIFLRNFIILYNLTTLNKLKQSNENMNTNIQTHNNMMIFFQLTSFQLTSSINSV